MLTSTPSIEADKLWESQSTYQLTVPVTTAECCTTAGLDAVVSEEEELVGEDAEDDEVLVTEVKVELIEVDVVEVVDDVLVELDVLEELRVVDETVAASTNSS